MIETARTWVLLRSLRRGVWRSPESLRRLQNKLLRAAVVYAYENIPFYRRLWKEHGFDAYGLRGAEDLGRIPIVNNQMIKEAAQGKELLTRKVNLARCTFHYTSGSTGIPLRICRQSLEESLWRAMGLRIWFEHGFRWHHMKAEFCADPGPSHYLQCLGISQTTWISTELSIEEQTENLLKAKADWVAGTPTALRRVARALDVVGARVKRPRAVFCRGELLDTETRAKVERVFGIDPVSIYGLTEAGYIAWQCEERDGFHINIDTHLAEVLRDGKPAGSGELGTIVVTDLRGRTMPVLRYDTGDLAVTAMGTCPCGRSLPMLASIEGRKRGSVLLGDGRILTTRVIVDHLTGTLRLGEYRLHQETTSRFRLELCQRAGKHKEHGGYHKTAIVSRLRKILGEVEVAIEIVRSWPRDEEEKTHAVSSAVPIPGL